MDTYTININCMNCGAPNALSIPKKTTINDFKKESTACINCECPIYPLTPPDEEKKDV